MSEYSDLFSEFDEPDANVPNFPQVPTHKVVALPQVPSHHVIEYPKVPTHKITETGILSGIKTKRNVLFDQYINAIQEFIFNNNMILNCYNKYPEKIGKSFIVIRKMKEELARLDKMIEESPTKQGGYKKTTKRKLPSKSTRKMNSRR